MPKKPVDLDEDNLPLTEADFTKMRPYHEAHPEFKAVDEAAAVQRKKRGRPFSDDPMVTISIRVHQSVLPKLRAKAGYQTQITRMVEDFAQA